jgi:hypothetical protein
MTEVGVDGDACNQRSREPGGPAPIIGVNWVSGMDRKVRCRD